MQDLNDKITGNTLTATEWNEVPSEIQNVIEALGQTLSSGDLNQLGKGIAGYVGNGNFSTDSGISNAYVLSSIGSKQSPTSYADGITIAFVVGNNNTGASTINAYGLGVKNIKLRGNIDPVENDISGRVYIQYDAANGWFELLNPRVTNRTASYKTIVELDNDSEIVVGQLVSIDDYATGHESGILFGTIVAAATGTDDGGSFIDLSASGFQLKQNFNRNFVSIRQFGAAPINTAAANSTAINFSLAYASAVYGPAGTYDINAELGVKDKQTFFGDGKYATIYRQSALNTPATMVGTTAGDEYQNIRDFQVQIRLASVGDVTQRGIVIRGSRRYILENTMVDNIDQSVSNYGGIGILLDMETTTNAYTARVANNTVLGCMYGLWSKGPITSSVFTKNHFKTANGMRFDRENAQAGVTPIFGNQIYANTIQAHSSATFGTGNGIDFGQSDAALGFTYAFANEIGWNYIEQFENGILLRDGSKNFGIDTQHWDNNTNDIVDLNADKDGYSGFDAQKFQLSTLDQIVQFNAKGSQFTDKDGGAITINGKSDSLDVDANGVTITTDKRRIRVTGNGAARTGTVLSRASAIEGQRVTLIGYSWAVAFSTTGLLLDGGVGVNVGNGTGEIALIEFEYDAGLDLWVECYRNTRV